MKQAVIRGASIKLSDRVRRRLKEGCGILLLAVAGYFLLSLFTYHSHDPSWSYLTNTSHVSNAGGRVGAWLADVFLYVFGYFAYSLPFLFAYGAWRLFRKKLASDDNVHDYYLMLLKVLGSWLILLTGSGLASLELKANKAYVPFSAGGIVGNTVSFKLLTLLNLGGALFILLGLLLLGITWLTGISWLTLVDNLGRYALIFLKKSTQISTYRIANGAKIFGGWSKNKWKKWHAPKLKREPEITTAREEPTPQPSDFSYALNPVAIPSPSLITNPVSFPSEEIEPERVAPRASKFSFRKSKKKEESFSSAIDLEVEEEDISVGSSSVQSDILMEGVPPIPVKKRLIPEKAAPVFNSPVVGTLPSLLLLDPPAPRIQRGLTNEKLEQMSREVEQRLLDFGVEVQVVAVCPGPIITRFEIQLAPGVKVGKITALAKDLARSLSVMSVRVVEVIPGRPVVGLELPNDEREMVRLSEVLSSSQYEQAASPLSLALGKDISGHPVIVDLAKMPHLLVAGTTGSGKSVGVNAMLLSFLFKATPQEVRLILIDPKMLELSVYDDIPHLLTPVITDMRDAASALRWCVAEMEQRYRLMAKAGVRNLMGYNQKMTELASSGEIELDAENSPELSTLPYIVVVIDEFADMMMVVGKKVEQLIARIAQKARAAGIHLILATQRPSVDVITGLIKSNIPTRIAFQVSSKIDSRTILDQQGAEQLLGHGDMLYLPPGTASPIRVHGAYVSDQEVQQVAADWRKRGTPNYREEITTTASDLSENGFNIDLDEGSEENDALYDQAVYFVTKTRKPSISGVQRRFKIGYNRAARLIEEMERCGVVSAMESSGGREVLAPPPPDDHNE